jgi:hypothetical protein
MEMKRIPYLRGLVACGWMFFFLTGLHGQEGPRIRAFEVRGLTRTKLSVVEPYYRHVTGSLYAEFSAEELIQDLRKLGIFNPEIQVFPQELPGENGDVNIIIVVEEKWTLLPFPFASATSSGNTYGGFAVIETNFLGYNKKIYALGMLSTRGWRGMFGYTDPAFLDSDFEYSFIFSGGVNEREFTNEDGDAWQNFETTDINLRGGVTWKASETLKFGLGAGFLDADVNEGFESKFPPPASVRMMQGSLSLQYDDLYYGDIFVYGFSARAQYERSVPLFADILAYSRYETNLSYQKEIFGEHRLGFSAAGMYIPGAPLIMERNIGGRILNTLPDDLAADSAASARASFEYLVFSFSWGALTAQALYEAGVFSLNGASPSYTHGPGGGLRVYLAKIALPAFGLDIYYNVRTGKTNASMYMGLSF